jgi:hypothetical protein
MKVDLHVKTRALPFFSFTGTRVAHSLVFCVAFCRSLFVLFILFQTFLINIFLIVIVNVEIPNHYFVLQYDFINNT